MFTIERFLIEIFVYPIQVVVKSTRNKIPKTTEEAFQWLLDGKIQELLWNIINQVEKIKKARSSSEKLKEGFKAAMYVIQFAENED